MVRSIVSGSLHYDIIIPWLDLGLVNKPPDLSVFIILSIGLSYVHLYNMHYS